MIKFVDLFAGTGGMRLALENACHELSIPNKCVFSSEINKKSCESYLLNFGENPLRDITETEALPDHDLLLAGFPCQSFSYAGKQLGFADTRGTLFFHLHRLIKQAKPKAFLLENVRGLTTHDKGRTFKTIIEHLNELEYSVKFFRLNSSNFNVPQNRVRIFILGLHKSEPITNMIDAVGPADSHRFKKESYQTDFFSDLGNNNIKNCEETKLVKDVLENSVDDRFLCSKDFTKKLKALKGENLDWLNGYRLIDTRNGNSIHSWDLGTKGRCSKKEKNFMNILIENRRKKKFGTHQDGKSLSKEQICTFYDGDFDKVTNSLIQKGYLSLKDKKYNVVCGNMSFEVFKFLDPHSISITLTASDTNRLGVVQNGIPRRITPREACRLQGFPDTYKLIPDDNAVYTQMGNAVTVKVVEEILTDFLKNNQLLTRN